MISTIIIDNDKQSALRLEKVISKRPGWSNLTTSFSLEEARQQLLLEEPDVCFLEIDMAEGSGIQLATELSDQISTKWVFITQSRDFALQAFDIDALGYILKPFDNKRLLRVIEKVEKLELGRMKGFQNTISKVAVKSIGEVKLIDFDTIMWIKGASNYVELHCEDKMYLHRETLSSIELRMPGQNFVRVHRSTIVNLDFINKIESELGRYSILILRNGQEIKISTAYKKRLFDRIGLQQ